MTKVKTVTKVKANGLVRFLPNGGLENSLDLLFPDPRLCSVASETFIYWNQINSITYLLLFDINDVFLVLRHFSSNARKIIPL